MKIRTGFVSNSSSSSFCVVTTKENHEMAMAELSDYQKKVVSQIMVEKTLGGMKVFIGMEFSGTNGEGTLTDIEENIEYGYEDDEDDEDEDYEDTDTDEDTDEGADEEEDEEDDDDECSKTYTAWEKYIDIINQRKDLVIDAEWS